MLSGMDANPEGPSTQYLRLLVPKTMPLMVLGARNQKYRVLGPDGKPTGICDLLVQAGAQRVQYSSIQEYSLNYNWTPNMI